VTVVPLRGAPTPALLRRVSAGQVGGVILLGSWTGPHATASAVSTLQATACRATGTPLLVGVDQEGGTVRRLTWAAPTESAAAMTTASTARAQGAAAGAALHTVGIGIDFAPVADTVATHASFLGTRSFGSDPERVALLASSFVDGLQSARVAATAKHFPGLGSAVASTDDRPVTIARSATFLDERLAPFRAAIASGARLVMVSNASYPALDPSGVPAVFSHEIVTGLLRGQLGFDGVVVSDALDAGAVVHAPHEQARALAAGVDLLLYSSTGASEAGYASLVHDAAGSRAVRQNLGAAIARVNALKAWLGLRCG
jgi:beta-N-acetylhexosaminidase